jgi:hypothetical protein
MSVIERLNGSKINYKFSIIEIVLKNEHNVKNSSRLFFKCKRAKKVMQTILSTRKPEKVILNKETFI